MAHPSSEKQPVKEDLFYHLRTINGVTTSKDFTVITASKADETQNDYVTEILLHEVKSDHSVSTQARALTKGYYKDRLVKIRPNSTMISFLSNRTVWKDKKLPDQLWFMDVNGGEPHYEFFHPNGINDYRWDESGNKLALIIPLRVDELEIPECTQGIVGTKIPDNESFEKFLQEQEKREKHVSDPMIITEAVYRRGTSYVKGRVRQLFVFDFMTKELKLLTNHPRDVVSPAFSPDGSIIYYLTKSPEGTNDTLEWYVQSVNLDTKETRKITVTYGYEPHLTISPDGKYLAVTHLNPELGSASNIQLKFINLTTGDEFFTPEEWDAHFVQPKFISEKEILFLSPRNSTVHLYKFDMETKKVEELISAKDALYITDFEIIPSSNIVAFAACRVNQYYEAYQLNMDTKNIIQFTNLNVELINSLALGEYHEFEFKGTDDLSMQGWYLTPPNFDPSKKYPVVVEVHGGPHVMWSPHEPTMFHEFQLLASNGYIVWFSNPSGSDGYGEDFRKRLIGNWGLAGDDVIKGLEKFLKEAFVDKQHVYLTGGSYGGWLTAWLIAQSNIFKAAVSQRGVYNLISMIGTTDIPNFNVREMGGITPWENLELFWQQSPISHVEKVQCPVLIIHSENDFRVPISQAEEYFVALKKFGKTVEFVRYPEDGHELSRSGKPSRRKDRLLKIIEWFKKYK